MIKQSATVVSFADGTVWVEAQRQSTCGQCQLKKGCGTGLLAEHVGKRFARLAIPNAQVKVEVGQQVQVGIAEAALLQGTAWLYLAPLVGLFLLAATAAALNLNDFYEIIFGLAGLFIGSYVAKGRIKRQQMTEDIFGNKTAQIKILKEEIHAKN